MILEEYKVFIPEGKYPMVWSLDDWCDEQCGNKNWLRVTKWDEHAFVPKPVGLVYSFKTEGDAVLFKLKWS